MSKHRLVPGAQTNLCLCLDRLAHAAQQLFSPFAGRSDNSLEERMRIRWTRLEFWVKLAAQKPGVAGDFHDLHISPVRGISTDGESVRDQRLLILPIKLITVAVPLGDFRGAVSAVCEGAWLQARRPGTQPHGAAELVHAAELAQLV